MKYKYGIVAGTSNIAFQCAARLSEEIPVRVLENNLSKFSVLGTKCRKVGLECLRADKRETMAQLAGVREQTIVFSVLNTFLFPPEIVSNPYLTIVNLHGALLPKFPGRNAEAWAIYEGACESGFTWHYIDETVDGGEMIAQGKVPITPEMTAGELFALINEQAYLCYERVLPDILNETAPRVKLHTNQEDIKYFRDVPNKGVLDISWDYGQASRFLRSMDFGAFPQFPQAGIVLDGVEYSWKRYVLEPEKKAPEFSFLWDGNDIELQFADGRIRLVKAEVKE